MRTKAILAVLLLAALKAPVVADEVADLILDLKDEDPAVRAGAAVDLGSTHDPKAVDPLIEALRDGDPFVRWAAAGALGEIGDPKAADPLVDALEDEYSLVRGAAEESLDKMAGDGECQWESFTPDQRAFAAQPGGVFPLRDNDFAAGSYIIRVGPAGEDGFDLPPTTWKTFGPYELRGGHKYKALIESTRGESLRFEEDSADLLSYSDPSPEYARVYARNNCPGNIWYAICLEKNASEFVNAPIEASCTRHLIPPEGEWTDSWFGTGISVDAGQTIFIKSSGTIQPSIGREIFTGPEGTFAVDYWLIDYSFRSDWGHGALIAKIGAAGAPIFIGDSTTFTAPSGGEIWLGVNDIDPGNNAGEFAVDVCLK